MLHLIDAIAAHALATPHAIALQGDTAALNYAQLQAAIHAQMTQLRAFAPVASMALAVDNSPAWVVQDVAALALSIPLVPIPAFFSPAQKLHTLRDAGVNVLCTDQAEDWQTLCPSITPLATTTIAGKILYFFQISAALTAPNAAKITYTSGTTGQPKGVCLRVDAMMQVAHAIQRSTEQTAQDRHFCVLPLATLLENVAGVYASLLAGAELVVWSCARVGFLGSRFDIHSFITGLATTKATTAILIPELAQALVASVTMQSTPLPALRFLAVGGAKVNPNLLRQAHALGLPLYEGYGLSESASVVTLNTPAHHRIGSIGKPLPHIQIRVDDAGELWIKGALLSGYTYPTGMVLPNLDAEGFVATGDLGYQDADGFWYLHGRKKNVFITSFGRNVSPEWVESELTHHALIAQACVFGEAQPRNTAVLVLRQPALDTAVASAIAEINHHLPDYARVGRWLVATSPFSPLNGQLTANGRLKRDVIWQHYQPAIEALPPMAMHEGMV